ncbi:hypothetical protein KEM54_002629 [Ascosphaera aggregata]|nr:hypothetical protein KEM54_002629 [Ascosphaera aggregata]
MFSKCTVFFANQSSQGFSSLTKLTFSSNGLTSTSQPLPETITELRLDYNEINCLDCLRHLTRLPHLARLSLRGNNIHSIFSDSSDSKEPLLLFSPTLVALDLSFNRINSWSFIDQLPKVFPGLKTLRISDNPLYMQPPAPAEVTDEPDKAMTIDEAYMLTLARIGQLKNLNYSHIDASDRQNGELYYLSLIRKQLGAHQIQEETSILRDHPRFQELCEMYGEQTIDRAGLGADAINPRSLAARLVNITFYLPESGQSVKKEIPKTMDVYTVKAFVARQFNIPPLTFRIVWETEEWDPVFREVVDEGEWDSEDEDEYVQLRGTIDDNTKEQGGQKFVRRQEELVDSTRDIGVWFTNDIKEARGPFAHQFSDAELASSQTRNSTPNKRQTMAEFWKSAERYWCKHCKVYVRDTSFERSQHEATGKHQGALKRFLRNIHREKERDEREGDRAKNEIERLKGIVFGGVAPGTSTARSIKLPPSTAASAAPAVVLAERKNQMAQLAEMGVAIPDEFRKEMAMVGDWTVVSETVEDDEAKMNATEAAKLNVGVRKRKADEDEEAEKEEERVVKKGWGSKFRSLREDDEDLDSLLAMTTSLSKKKTVNERQNQQVDKQDIKEGIKQEDVESKVKKESPEDDSTSATLLEGKIKVEELNSIKAEQDKKPDLHAIPEEPKERQAEEVPTVVFKKRKTKQIRR